LRAILSIRPRGLSVSTPRGTQTRRAPCERPGASRPGDYRDGRKWVSNTRPARRTRRRRGSVAVVPSTRSAPVCGGTRRYSMGVSRNRLARAVSAVLSFPSLRRHDGRGYPVPGRARDVPGGVIADLVRSVVGPSRRRSLERLIGSRPYLSTPLQQ
jgi:hypothetical protein